MQNRAKVTISFCCLFVLLLSCPFTGSLSGQESYSVDRINVGRIRAIIYRFDPQTGVRIGTSGWIVEVRDSTLLFDNGDELMWVESTSGERIEFVEGSGRIEGTRNVETRRVDYVVSGTDMTGQERRFSIRSLTLLGTRVEIDDTWGTAGIIAVSVAAVTGVILVVTGSL